LEILSPPVDFMALHSREPWRDVNENSLVVKVTMGATSILFTGDIGRRIEAELAGRFPGTDLHSTVLVVPHHGSAGSSSKPFVEAVSPRHAVISCGWMNRFGFPHPDAMRRLESAGSRVWITAEAGAVEITLDGAHCRVASNR
jgi:competence protein ComEC